MNLQDERMSALGWYPVRLWSRRVPTESDLCDLERQMGGALPLDYRRFLARYGQGALQKAGWYPIRERCPWGQWGIVDEFLGFSTNSRSGILEETFETFEGQIPAGTLVMAYDPGGNLLLIAIASAAMKGSIWFWDHEHRPRAMPGEYVQLINGHRSDVTPADNLYAVTDDFTSFLASLGHKSA